MTSTGITLTTAGMTDLLVHTPTNVILIIGTKGAGLGHIASRVHEFNFQILFEQIDLGI